MKKILLFLACVAVFSSCIEDNGNYDYKDVNEVTINVPTYNYVRLEEQTYRLDPQIAQSMAKDNSNLEYVWKMATNGFASAGASQDTLSTEPYIDIVIDPTNSKLPFKQYFWLYVRDKLTDVVYPANTALIINKPYDGAWMVLHEQGGAKLAGIEFISDGSTNIMMDAFADAGASTLTGNPIGLGFAENMGVSGLPEYYTTYGVANYNLPFIITDDVRSAGQYAQARKFGLARTIADMPQNKSLITNEKLSKFTMMDGNNTAVSMVLDGVFYQGRAGLRLYEAKVAPGLLSGGVTPYIKYAEKVGWTTFLYDSNGRRFLAYNNNGNSSSGLTMDGYKAADNSVEITDVNRADEIESVHVNPVPDDREVVYLGTGPSTTANARGAKPIALALGKNGNPNSYVYVFIPAHTMFTSSISQIERIRTFVTPESLNENSVFASSVTYSTVLFYATGNVVYRLDYSTGRATPIYVHPTDGKIKKMKFARHNIMDNSIKYDAYGVDVTQSLGVLIETGTNSSEFVVLNLSPSGFLSDETSVRPNVEVFTGFGRGVDILFL